MKARILEKSEEDKWDEFVYEHPLATVHQHSQWGHFQQKIPARGDYWIIALEEDKKLIGGTMLIRHQMAKEMTWLYSARGPLIDYNSENLKEQMKALLIPIEEIAKQQNSIFYRIDPPLIKEIRKRKRPKIPGFHRSSLGFQPEHTLIIDLKESEAKILEQMKQKGRYNIRLATKKGVKIRKSDPRDLARFEKDIEIFHKILHETTMRDHFYGHKKLFYKNMIETLYSIPPKKHEPHCELYIAEYKKEPIAGIINTFYDKTVTYYYGASSNEHRNLMAPYLLQWEAIKEAKRLGYEIYDFLGISPPDAKHHAWAGVTEFKKKFGGIPLSYMQAQEYAFMPFKHCLYKLYKKFH